MRIKVKAIFTSSSGAGGFSCALGAQTSEYPPGWGRSCISMLYFNLSILSREREDWTPCRSRASAFPVPCLSFSVSVWASRLPCQLSDRITLVHTWGGGSPPLPSRTSTRSVWFQTCFIQYCGIYQIQLTHYFVKSYTFDANLQSVARSRLFDR